jgi:DNA-binding transcriptional LysR family regulator
MCKHAHMDWADLHTLLVLLRARTLQQAASALGVDRTTVGRRVDALEERLGAKLFVRTREGVRPTATAERLRPYAERMEVEAASLAQVARAGATVATGSVRVATTEALSTLLVTEGLLTLREQHPELVIELLGGNRPVDLTRGEADIALRLVPVKEAALRVRCVARLGFGLFAAPHYLHARGVPRSPAGLSGHDVLLPGGELAATPEAKWLAARPGVRVVFRSSSFPTLVEAAATGLGIVPLTLAWGDRDRRLTRLMPIDAVAKRGVWLVTKPEGALRAEVRVVGDRIAAILAASVRV